MKLKLLLSVALLAVSSVSTALAIPINANGTIGFNSTGGAVTYTGGPTIDLATTVSLPIPNSNINCGTGGNICEQITSLSPLYLGVQNDFAPGGHTPETINNDITFSSGWTLDLSFVTLPTFIFSAEDAPVNRFTFTASSGAKAGGAIGNSNFLFVEWTGTFTDAGGTYNSAPASLSLSFNQTGGPTGTVTYSGTFATPPQTFAPEPATMALLGSALIGLGLIGRKRLAR